MHFEILVEDASGKIALENNTKKILGENYQEHSYRIISYRGIGHLPKDLRGRTDPRKRILLDRLPKILAGYGKSLPRDSSIVIVVIDLDDKDCIGFKKELLKILGICRPAPNTLFRIAIEEGEAWFLGDKNAVKRAYPNAKSGILNSYIQDSICGTWERLADAIYPGGSTALKKLGWPYIGQTKCIWAEKISPHINIDANKSKSFQVFKDGLLRAAEIQA